MAKTTLEVKLNDKILSINGADVSLHKSLFNARSFNDEGTDYLELQYRTKDESDIYRDAEDIYFALGSQEIGNIDVHPCPENKDYLAVALSGEFNAKVYRRK